MASAGTRGNDAEFKRNRIPKLTHPLLEKPKLPKNSHVATQVLPIWKVENKNANLGYNRQPVHYTFPHAYFSGPRKKAVSITPSPPQTPPRYLHETLEKTLVFQRPLIHQRPYRRTESPSLNTKSEVQRPYSSFCRCPPVRPFLKSIRTASAMTSSLIDQFPLPSAAGEPTEVGIRRPSSVSTKLPSDASRPALITNSFLRPTSAKVPLSPQRDSSNNQISPHVGSKSASWHNSEKVDFALPNNGIPTLAHNSISTGNVSTSIQEAAKMEATTHVIPNVTNVPYRGVQLTEAVRRLAGRHLDAPKAVCQKEEAFASCVEKSPSAFHPGLPDNTALDNLISEGHCLKDVNDNPFSANTCNQGINNFIAAENYCNNLGTFCTSTETSSITNKPHLPVTGELAPPMNITVMASQISTIHLNRTCVKEAGDQPGSATSDLDLPVPNCEPDCAEEELPEGLDDSQDEEQDEEDPEDPSIIQVSSTTSMLASPRQCADNMDQTPVSEDIIVKPALTPSLFPNIPPTLYFGTQDEKVELLPWVQRKLLKWKMSTVTPNIVKQAVARSHFRVTKKTHDWLGCWGHHMKSTAFKSIREYQKLNHFPGSFQIGRKDRLWRNLSKMQARFGRKEFNFFPQSFVLPQDIKLLKKAWEEGGTRQKWIVKPPASARGMGIQVIHKWSQLPKKRPLLVQRYLHKPYLISGSKFDLRIYVYVTSYDPLRVYMFTDGLVRFASCKYSSSMKSLSNKFMHLTNYSVNKKNVEYKANTDETACQGHKWALKALWTYLNQKGFSSEKIWEKIKEMVIKTIIASEPYVNSFLKMYVQNPHSCHELFGFDIMLDENLKPWVLEVNISPSLHSNSPLDVNIKGQMIRDLLNLAGFLLPNKEDISASNASGGSVTSAKDHGRIPEIINDEKMKRAYYLSQKLPDKDLYATVLDQLTPEDVRVLAETEDELSRCGQFERIFPSPISSRYLRFFEQQRYFNILTNQWEQKYYNDREKGCELLRSLCMMKFHMGSVQLPHSPVKSPGHSVVHLNGFIRGDLTTPSCHPGLTNQPT
ncbi:tubulin monoglutamylase TTLL4 isoform X2 [Pyxicephalus adspersus]|uniref:tubulin monoglutamylase TTLL4 isoform X2 n=1 Tax=Pyxicephalus adspersus TaxID=30357 RepID=UPI003B590CEA